MVLIVVAECYLDGSPFALVLIALVIICGLPFCYFVDLRWLLYGVVGFVVDRGLCWVGLCTLSLWFEFTDYVGLFDCCVV